MMSGIRSHKLGQNYPLTLPNWPCCRPAANRHLTKFLPVDSILHPSLPTLPDRTTLAIGGWLLGYLSHSCVDCCVQRLWYPSKCDHTLLFARRKHDHSFMQLNTLQLLNARSQSCILWSYVVHLACLCECSHSWHTPLLLVLSMERTGPTKACL